MTNGICLDESIFIYKCSRNIDIWDFKCISYGISLAMVLIFPGDLPPFLKSLVDSLVQYMRYCDTQMTSATNTTMIDNLKFQKNLLMKQMEITNNLILKYRVSQHYNL